MSPSLKLSRFADIGVLGLNDVCNKTKGMFSDGHLLKDSLYGENFKPLFERYGMGRYYSGRLAGSLLAAHCVLGTCNIHRETGRYYILGSKLLPRSSSHV